MPAITIGHVLADLDKWSSEDLHRIANKLVSGGSLSVLSINTMNEALEKTKISQLDTCLREQIKLNLSMELSSMGRVVRQCQQMPPLTNDTAICNDVTW